MSELAERLDTVQRVIDRGLNFALDIAFHDDVWHGKRSQLVDVFEHLQTEFNYLKELLK